MKMSPDDPIVVHSKLVEDVLGPLEGAGVPTEINDSIVAIIEWWERGAYVIDYSRKPGTGFLLVGHDNREVVVNLDRDRTGHLTFSPQQARDFAWLLVKQADALDGGAA